MSEPSRPPIGRRALPGLLFVVLVVAVYSPTLFTRRNFVGRDLLVYNLPIEKAIHDSWSKGSVPVWLSEISGGRPLAANPNAGVFYPVRPLLSLVPFPVAVRVYPVLHWAAAGLGMLLLVRSLRGSRSAAWVGAVTYAFSGAAVSEVFYTNYQPGMTLLPWVVWAVQRRSGSAGNRLLVVSLLFGLLFLAGDVFTIGAAVLSCALWIVIEGERSRRARELAALGLSLLLAALVAAPQIVAAALWVSETNRGAAGMRLADALTFSVSPLRLLELAIPFPFGPTWLLDDSRIWGWPAFGGKTIGFFTTFYAGALALIGLASSWKWKPPGARFARALFLAALAAAVLPSFVPAAWADLPSPLPLRFPEKFAVAFVFALALLAGLAVDRLREKGPRRRWILAAAVLFAGLSAAAALFPARASTIAVAITHSGRLPPRLPEAPTDPGAVAKEEVPAALAEGAMFWIATLAALELLRRPGRGPLVAALVLLTAVPIASNRKIARTSSEEVVFRPTPFARYLEGADPENRYRTLGESFYRDVSPMQVAHAKAGPAGLGQSWVQYRQVLYSRGTVFNFDLDVGDFARSESLRRISSVLASTPEAKAFFGNFSLRYGIRFRDQQPLPGYRRVGGDALQDWDELPNALPDVRLAEAWREERGPMEAARALPLLASGELVVESGAERRGSARPGTVHVIERSPNALRLETEAPDASWLFVLRGFWGYRDVRVDGRSVDTVPAQLGFSAVPLPSGRHRVEWRETLPGHEISRWGPAVFGLLMAGLFARERRKSA
ncbi:MAG TPA: YfhO family protein [Thermoanaerobaculia bacterium]|nr:YfhO family protein [Thermoanaerobaculia bacterium]